MTGLLENTLRLLRLDFAASADREIRAREDAIGSDIARRYTRGNVNIQVGGGFLTKAGLDREVESLAKLKFKHK